ncbi:MAG: hypothetical protein H6657_26010 [Ardenticatenaceae bacterium]|nr:hypothetical protein [Ardenticatenaceae bacterium]
MENLPALKHLYYQYIGRLYAFAYFSQRRTFLGAARSGWLRFFVLALLIASIILRWSWIIIILAFLLWVYVGFIYRRAKKEGYNKFVVDETAVPPPDITQTLEANEKVPVRASGRYAITTQSETVLLIKPAHYWHVPLGDHIVMVEHRPKQFLYQFFNAATLQKVEAGWILFGKEPLPTLAITFLENWGPDHSNNALMYYVGGGANEDLSRLKPRTIYFSFDNLDTQAQLWATLIKDARDVRASQT